MKNKNQVFVINGTYGTMWCNGDGFPFRVTPDWISE